MDGAVKHLPSRADFRFFLAHRVRYVELDTQGIAFNAHYLAWGPRGGVGLHPRCRLGLSG